MTECALCLTTGGHLLWENDQLRIIDALDPLYPGFTRVIWKAHVAEMTDLTPADQLNLMQVVLKVESVQRAILLPDKINLAAFGNMVPHLHWHIIPRWRDDAHFPQPVWANLPESNEITNALHEKRRSAIIQLIPDYHAELMRQMQSMKALTGNKT